jgi:hypothetical protein
LWWLSDRFLVPQWSPYRVTFSLGDIFISLGAFWLLWRLVDKKEALEPPAKPARLSLHKDRMESG